MAQTTYKDATYYYNEHGIMHRLDGPAIVYDRSHTSVIPRKDMWYINGDHVKDIEEWALQVDINLDNLNETDIAMIQAKYGYLHGGATFDHLIMINNLYGVQPMTSPTGQIFKLRFRY